MNLFYWYNSFKGFENVLSQDVNEFRHYAVIWQKTNSGMITFSDWWHAGNRAKVRFRRLRLWWRQLRLAK